MTLLGLGRPWEVYLVAAVAGAVNGSKARAKSLKELHKEAFTKLETVSEMVTRCPSK